MDTKLISKPSLKIRGFLKDVIGELTAPRLLHKDLRNKSARWMQLPNDSKTHNVFRKLYQNNFGVWRKTGIYESEEKTQRSRFERVF